MTVNVEQFFFLKFAVQKRRLVSNSMESHSTYQQMSTYRNPLIGVTITLLLKLKIKEIVVRVGLFQRLVR